MLENGNESIKGESTLDNKAISLNDGEELQENNSTSEETQQAALPEFPEEALPDCLKAIAIWSSLVRKHQQPTTG